MNTFLFILVAWFTLGVACAIGSWWYMKTHEQRLLNEIPEVQILGWIPHLCKWVTVLVMLLFGPALVLWGFYEAIKEWRNEKDQNVSGAPPVAAAAPDFAPDSPWMVLFALVGIALGAWIWASTPPAQPLATSLANQAWEIGKLLFLFALVGAVARENPLREWRWVLPMAPFWLLGLFPAFVSTTVEWEGGWAFGIAGAAAGATAGAAAGWLFARLIVPEVENPPELVRPIIPLPVVFAVLMALLCGYIWASGWPVEQAWAIALFPITFAFLGVLVGKPFQSMVTALPVALVQLVPLVGSLTVGWEGGWPLGIAGAAAGAAAGWVNGWLYARWIMPEYEKRREQMVRQRQASAGPGSSGAIRNPT
jgi:hypothetical protein